MMTAKLKTWALVMVLLALLGLVAWQQQQINLLRTEGNRLREQLAQATSLKEEAERSVQQVKQADQDSQAAERELVRLRGQVSRLHQLEQETAQLKAERTRLSTEATQARPVLAAAALQQPAAPAEVPGSPAAAGTTDLGVVEFANRVPQRLNLGAGKECLVTATALADGNLQIAFTATSVIDGVPVQSERNQTAPPGKPIALVIEGVELTLTPTLKAP